MNNGVFIDPDIKLRLLIVEMLDEYMKHDGKEPFLEALRWLLDQEEYWLAKKLKDYLNSKGITFKESEVKYYDTESISAKICWSISFHYQARDY